MREWFSNFGKKPVDRHDPTMASLLTPPQDSLRVIRKNDYGRDVVAGPDGLLLHEIIQNETDQMFLARLLKGVIPVSDIVFVKDDGRFYSQEIPLEDVMSGADYTYDKVNARIDILILDLIFSDGDHSLRKRIDSPVVGHNAQSDGTKTVFYDFGAFPGGFFEDRSAYSRDSKKEADQFEGAVRYLHHDENQKRIALERLAELRLHLEGESGISLMRAILASMKREGAGTPYVIEELRKEEPSADPVVVFQEEILRRISLMEQAIG